MNWENSLPAFIAKLLAKNKVDSLSVCETSNHFVARKQLKICAATTSFARKKWDA